MSEQALTLSIIIPVYNDERHLKKCLESIAVQSVVPDDVIVVDNNSNDGSAKLAHTYPFVRVITEKQQGIRYARAAGFDAATTDIIGRIDADTILLPNWTRQVKEIFENKKVMAVSGPVGYHDAPGEQVGLFVDQNLRQAMWRIGKKDDAVFLFGSNMALRRSAWESVRGDLCDRSDIHEDIDIAIHMYDNGMPVIFDKTLIAYTSSRRMSDPVAQMIKYLKAYKNTYKVHGIESPAITLTTAIVLSTQYGVKLLRRGYDEETRQFSLKKFIASEDDSRISPIT